MKLSPSTIWRVQRQTPPPAAQADLTGQTIVMVGCSSGIGFEATKHLCRMNPARVILAARSEAKGREAVQEIKAATGTDVELWLVDLAELDSVTAFADRFEKDGSRLDLLVYNAGVNEWKYSVTADGYETMIAVNHLAAAMLQLALLPRLVDTAATHGGRPRTVVQVASDSHYFATYDKEVLASNNTIEKLSDEKYCKKSGKMANQYNISKLMNVMFIKSLNAHLPPSSPVFVNPRLLPHRPLPASSGAHLVDYLATRDVHGPHGRGGLPSDCLRRDGVPGHGCEPRDVRRARLRGLGG